MTEGTIRRPRKSEDHEELALDFSTAAVGLFARRGAGEWAELGAAPLGAGDFAGRIAALRAEAAERGSPAVTLWLPPEEITVREYRLTGRGARARAEALRLLAADTYQAEHELSVALAPHVEGGPVTVLGARNQTIGEARDYARRWGFRPGRVSTRAGADRFGPAGPEFATGGTALARAFGAAARPAIAAVALLALGAAAWGAYRLLPEAEAPPVIVASGPELTGAPSADDAPGLDGAAFSVVGRPEAPPQAAGDRRAWTSAGHAPLISLSAAASPAPALPPGLTVAEPARPAEPSLPEHGGPVDAGAAPDLPRRSAPGRPDRPAEAGGRIDLAALQTGIERIRSEARAPVPSATATEPAAAVAALPREAEGAADPGAPVAEAQAGDLAALATDEARPAGVPPVPVPRPAALAAPEAPAPAEQDEVEVAKPDAPAPAAPEAEPAPPAAGSELAALNAPRPAARPARRLAGNESAAPVRGTAAAAPAPGGTTPRRLRDAAAQQGLALDTTSLIGVIDASSGRQALLRMPGGNYLRVERGDDVAGWQVNAIAQDAVRLTRQGESRTLLLVTR